MIEITIQLTETERDGLLYIFDDIGATYPDSLNDPDLDGSEKQQVREAIAIAEELASQLAST